FITIGKKGNDIIKKSHRILSNHNEVFDALTFENIAPIADDLAQRFVNGEYDRIVLEYNQFKNAGTQSIREEQFLPLVASTQQDEQNAVDYIFEPAKEDIVQMLIPKMLKTQLYKAVRDSFAAEHGARMTAMHKATDNATALRNQLKLTYNKARQAAITNEILEIVGGAEALNG